MACERYRDALADLAAGGPVPEGLESHLASCEPCGRELAMLRAALAEADRDMVSLLATAPSPDLQARIRRATAAHATSALRVRGWIWPAAAAAAGFVVMVTLLARRPSPVPPGSPGLRPRVAPSAPAADPTVGAAVSPPTEGTGPAGAGDERAPMGSRGAARRAIPPQPEVLVPPGENEALLRFAADLQQRVVPPDSLLVKDLLAPLPEPKTVEIEPIEIVPLDPAEASGTD